MTKQEYYEKLHLAKELYHHGVEGQKWGKQNGPPYPLNERGQKKLAKQIERNMRIKNFNGVEKSIKKSKIEEQVNSQIDLDIYVKNMTNYNEQAKTIYEDYKKNENVYTALSGIMNLGPYDKKLGDMSRVIHLYQWDDLDVGFNNSRAVYAHNTNKVKDIETIVSKSNDIYRNYENDVEKYVRDTMGSYGLDTIKTGMYYKTAQKQVWSYITSHGTDTLFDNGSWITYDIEDAVSQGNWDNNSDVKLREAKKTLSKIDKSIINDFKGWSKFNEAVEKLGYSNVPYDEVTDSMWGQINAEIRKINKGA